MRSDFLEGVELVSTAGDVVAKKHAHGFVAADAHGHGLWNPSPDHVADCRPAEVMEEPPRHVRRSERLVSTAF
jgi:hypothetical protein